MPKKLPNPIPDTLITYDGRTQKLKHWAKDLGLDYHLLYMRYKRGDRDEQLLRPYHKPVTAPDPANIYLTFNNRTRSLAQWSRIYRASILGVMRRYESGVTDFYELFDIKFDLPTMPPISNTTTRT